MAEKKELKFEEALAKLEKIVEGLEGGELSLEESMERYEEGVRLSKLCSKRLEEAKRKIEQLLKTGDGKFITKPLGKGDVSEG
ncbi:MAG: exodeoxyribonuclease VII small subunit [Candidatus Omnitrophota bacterium]